MDPAWSKVNGRHVCLLFAYGYGVGDFLRKEEGRMIPGFVINVSSMYGTV